MAKRKRTTTDMSRAARIKREENRLRKELADVSGNRRRLVVGLVQRAAFLRIEAEDLEDDINEHGSTELFQNGPDAMPMTRIRAAAQHHDKVVRAYTTICKQLADLTPDTPDKMDAGGALESLLANKAKARQAPGGLRRVK